MKFIRISIDRRIAERIILRRRHTCMRGERCLRSMGGFISQSISYMKGSGWNEC